MLCVYIHIGTYPWWSSIYCPLIILQIKIHLFENIFIYTLNRTELNWGNKSGGIQYDKTTKKKLRTMCFVQKQKIEINWFSLIDVTNFLSKQRKSDEKNENKKINWAPKKCILISVWTLLLDFGVYVLITKLSLLSFRFFFHLYGNKRRTLNCWIVGGCRGNSFLHSFASPYIYPDR